MTTSSLIIAICVAIPALIALSVCAIICYSNRNKNRKFQRERSSSYEDHQTYERRPQDDHIVNFSRAYRYRQQRRLGESPPVLEQPPPSYHNSSINQPSRQQLPLFSTVRTTPSTTHVHQTSHGITPSIHAAMPPSYAEIFLTPHTLTNR